MPMHTKVSGAWKQVNECHVKVSGAWKKCSQVYVKVNGEWKPVLLGSNQFQFTVNTQAMISGSKKSAVPFQLYEISGATLSVDWGDGSTSTLTSSNYSLSNSTASVHTYSTAGTYTITVTSNDWAKIYWFHGGFANSDATAASYWFTQTVTSVNSSVPKLKGSNVYFDSWGITAVDKYDDYFDQMFSNCEKLTSISEDIFYNITNAISFVYAFENCKSLSTIPTTLFLKNTNLQVMQYCFENCSNLGNFTITMGSTKITCATKFVDLKSGATRIVRVPNNSTTKTEFDSIAEGLGLTIQTY